MASESRLGKVGRLLKRRSLIWVLPERWARALSWTVVLLAGLLPLLLTVAGVWRIHTAGWRRGIERALSDRLGVDVHVGSAHVDTPQHVQLKDIAFGSADGVFALEALSGSWESPRDDNRGRLVLTEGQLTVNLGWWSSNRSQSALVNRLQNSDLGTIILDRFTGRLALADVPVDVADLGGNLRVVDAEGREDPVDDAIVDGSFSARAGTRRARDSMVFRVELGDGRRRLELNAEALPWASQLLKPTLGETLTGALGPCRGLLVLSPDLETGTAQADNWKLDNVTTTLDLSRLDDDLGLGGMTGTLDVRLQTFGRIGRPGTLVATLKLPRMPVPGFDLLRGPRFETTSGTIPPDVLRRLNYLVTGRLSTPVDLASGKPVRFTGLELHVILTPSSLQLQGRMGLHPAIMTGTSGEVLLSAPAEGINLDTLLKRISELRLAQQAEHTS